MRRYQQLISISKKLIILVICAGILLSNVYAVVAPTSSFYVNDYAGLLSDNTKQYIINVNTSLESQTGAQVVVVTVPNLEGMSLEEYATTLFRQFGIGNRTKNNGVLLLLALEEREFRVEVGYGLEGALNDSKTGRIQDQYIIPYLKHNKWDEGIKNGFDAIILEMCEEYNISVTSDKPVIVGNSQGISDDYTWLGAGGFITEAVLGIITRVKKWKALKGFGLTILGTGVFGVLAWILIPDSTGGIIFGIMSVVIGIIAFLSALSGGNSRYYGGRGGRGGFSGGGGRSGGGGSSRGF